MSRTPNYVLTSPHTISMGPMDYKILDAGTFVTPLQLSYVPQHIIDDPFNKYHNDEVEVFCYTRHGVVSIPRRIIREK